MREETRLREACDAVLAPACGTAFTAAVARVERGGRLCFEQAYGVTRLDAPDPAYVDTRFDLASLTKLFVSTIALRLAAAGHAVLDAPLAPALPAWAGAPKNRITLRMLLAHTSGMHSGADYRTLFDRDVVAFALERELAADPGEKVIYSDLGMIALGAAIERLERRSLAASAAAHFGRPRLRFDVTARERPAIPATECDAWRGRVQGMVHDEKAYLIGRACGHAGLFGTAADVAMLTEAYLAPHAGRESALLPAAVAREAVREAAFDPVLRRGLGWALKTSDDNSCGRRFSRSSFGHTGFTGTCVWADPERDLQAVLLTNTVYFGRADSRPLRAAFFEAVVEAVER
jgi:CubicO group peptidase (beta-lactamase class C family)